MRPLVLAVVLVFSGLASANSIKVGTLTYMGHGTFQVDMTQGWLVMNFLGVDYINGSGSSNLVPSHTFQAGHLLPACPCFSAGFDLTTPTGHNYLLTLPNLGSRMILGTTHNTMLGPFQPGDMRSINITTVPEPSTLVLLGMGLFGIALKMTGCKPKMASSGKLQ